MKMLIIAGYSGSLYIRFIKTVVLGDTGALWLSYKLNTVQALWSKCSFFQSLDESNRIDYCTSLYGITRFK